MEVGKTATATIDTNYDGTLSVVSNDESKATVTINDKVITVTGVAAGTTTLTVTGAATSNFNAISKTIDVTVTASSATTPAFAYFEETATINVGEILKQKTTAAPSPPMRASMITPSPPPYAPLSVLPTARRFLTTTLVSTAK